MDASAFLQASETAWGILKDRTSSENGSTSSFVLRLIISIISYGYIYTRAAGSLLNALAYLVSHHWYVLGVVSSTVVLLISAALLAMYEWMWKWQSRLLSTVTTSHRRPFVVDDDEEESASFWLKKIGRFLFMLICWTVYCWINAAPILIGAAYTLYHMIPSFYAPYPLNHSYTAATTLPATPDEPHMQSLLS